jgi:hypothetical protein
MKRLLTFTLFYALLLRGGNAQNQTLITKNFKFKDGIYRQFAHFQRNQPDRMWEDLETNLVTSTQTLQTQIEFLKDKKTQQTMSLDSVWGIVVDGIPYIKLPKEAQKKAATIFSGLTLRGKICYFQFEDMQERKVPMTVYIPETGQPYFTKNMVKHEPVTREILLKFETGEMQDFTLFNFRNWIADDKDLLTTVNDLKPKEVPEKLFKCLLIYNDRNPVFLK